MFLIRLENDGRLFSVEAQHIHHHPTALGHLLQFLAVDVEEIQMIVAILFTLKDEFRVIPWQEFNGMEWFYVFITGLTI